MLVEIPTLRPRPRRGSLCSVPPSPELINILYAEFTEKKKNRLIPPRMRFPEYFAVWRSQREGENFVGLDDGAVAQASSDSPQLITRPASPLKGVISTLVLLVDFDDRPHKPESTQELYSQMLFGEPGTFLTGSMRDYYRVISNYNEATGEGIDIQGRVAGWFRLPQTSQFYTNSRSGRANYPGNAQRMAEDAVRVAMSQGVDFNFDPSFDALGEGMVTALFIIHSGSGAENTNSVDDFWSLKWTMPNPVTIANGLVARTFLTVPEDCHVGVCVHEWGHLAARWADYYDTGDNNLLNSNGLGSYCLMAYGSWGNGGITPSLPNGMLRTFHDWIDVQTINESKSNIVLRPAAEGGGVAVLHNRGKMKPSQRIFVEYRRRLHQDAYLPDQGIAIYLVDFDIDNVNDEDKLAIELLQADNQRDLAQIFFQGNPGDADDLYPSTINGTPKRVAGKGTKPPLSYTGQGWPGITIRVKGTPGNKQMTIDVKIEP